QCTRETSPPSARRAATALLVLLWLLVVVFVAEYLYLNVISLLGATLTDFHVYHEALGHAVRGETIYDLGSGMPFLYPPFYLIVLWPLGWLSEPTAMTVWLHLQSAFLVISLLALLAVFRPLDLWFAAWAIILFTGFSPVMLNSLYGQTNLLYLAILAVFILAYCKSIGKPAKGRYWEIIAALALSVAVSIRILPLALLVLVAVQRRYRMVLWTVGFVAVEALAAGALVGFAAERDYFTSYVFRLRGLENMREISLLALGEKLVSPRVAAILFVAAVGAAVAVFFALVMVPARRQASSPALHVAFVIISMVLFAPLLEYHHYTILLAPYALVLGELRRRQRLSLTSALPVFLSWAIVAGANQLSYYGYGAIAFAALGGAALIWVYCVWLIVRNGAAPPGRPGESHLPGSLTEKELEPSSPVGEESH
ncbi:MAG: hypothetical protein AMJ84_12540, partial [Acidithiobacillales bacterium SM23_46]